MDRISTHRGQLILQLFVLARIAITHGQGLDVGTAHTNAPDPIFIAGCGHSGTSVMLRLIGEHPSIYMFNNETCALCRIGYGLEPGEEMLSLDERARRRLLKLESQFQLNKKRSEQRWVEKTPIHVRYLHRLFRLRPDAKVVLLVRDGRDVVASFKQRSRLSPSHPQYNASFQTNAERWIHDTSHVVKWSLHPHVHTVRYESLVRDTSTELNSLFNFLDEPYDQQQILQFYKQQQSFNGRLVSDKTKINSTVHHEGHVNHDVLRAAQFNSPLFDGSGTFRLPPPRGLSKQDFNIINKLEEFSALSTQLGYDD